MNTISKILLLVLLGAANSFAVRSVDFSRQQGAANLFAENEPSISFTENQADKVASPQADKSASPEPTISWTNDSLLRVVYTVAPDTSRIRPNYSVRVEPVIADTADTTASTPTIALPVASFEGKRYTRYADREAKHTRDSLRADYIIRRQADTVTVDTTILVPASLRHSSTLALNISRSYLGCCRTYPMGVTSQAVPYNEPDTVPEELLAKAEPEPEPEPEVESFEPLPVPLPIDEVKPEEPVEKENVYVKHISQYRPYDPAIPLSNDSASIYVQFPVNGYTVDSIFRNNALYLAGIQRMVDRVMSDTTISLAKIVIIGSSSVEGGEKYNIDLSRRRAESLRKYVTGRYGLRGAEFEIVAAGEAWADFRLIIAETPLAELPERDALLDIIDNTPDPWLREHRLRQYADGKPWDKVLRHILPDQRNAGYIQMYYR